MGEIFESLRVDILTRDYWVCQRPFDTDIRVVPCNRDLVVGGIIVCALVFNVRFGTQNTITMGKSRRDKKLAPICRRQFDTHPFAKCWRALANIDRDIKYFAIQRAHQLALIVRMLGMQTAQYTHYRARVVVLHEINVNTGGRVSLPVPGLKKESAVVLERLRLDNENIRELSWLDTHTLVATQNVSEIHAVRTVAQ